MENINDIMQGSDKLEPARHAKESDSAIPDPQLKYGLKLYTMADLMAQEFPDEIWVVDGLIPEGITVISARPASFKTWLLLSLATNVAQGEPMFDHFVTDQAGVLMIDEENSGRLLQQRLKMLGAPSDLPVYFMVEQGFRLEDKSIGKVIQFCEDNGIGLITFDSLVRIHRGEENASSAMAEVFGKMRRFTRAGINVVITHHHRKGNKDNADDLGQELRGSSDILAAVDCHIAIGRDEGNRLVLTQTKVRHASEYQPVEIEVASTDDSLTFNYLGTLQPSESKKAKTTTAIQDILKEHGEMNQKDLGAKLEENDSGVNAKTLRNILNDMVLRKTIESSRGKGKEMLYRLAGTTPEAEKREIADTAKELFPD